MDAIKHSQDIMMDSGAFSVWSTGAEINLKAYIKFCLDNRDSIDTVIGLDVIPGRKGAGRPSREDIEKAASQGWDNYLKMVKGGIPADEVVPVFHQFDDFKWLKLFIEKKVPYIGLSPRKQGVTRAQQQAWLDACMDYVTDSEGRAKTKLHGFGLTSMAIVLRYPWFSVDSASSMKDGMYGTIYIPWQKNGEWFFLHTPRRITGSSKSGERKKKNEHVLTLPKRTQEVCFKWFAEAGIPFGKSEYSREALDYKHEAGPEAVFERHADHLIIEHLVEPGILNCHPFRTRLNSYFFERVVQALDGVERRFAPKARRQGLMPRVKVGGRKALMIDRLKIYIAGDVGGDGKFTGHEALPLDPCRLLSYFYVNGCQAREFKNVIAERRS